MILCFIYEKHSFWVAALMETGSLAILVSIWYLD